MHDKDQGRKVAIRLICLLLLVGGDYCALLLSLAGDRRQQQRRRHLEFSSSGIDSKGIE